MSAQKKLHEIPEHEGLLGKLGKALDSAGQEAARLARLGKATAQLEKESLLLRSDLADLGRAAVNAWAKEPAAKLGVDHPALDKPLKVIFARQEKITALREQLAALKRSEGRRGKK